MAYEIALNKAWQELIKLNAAKRLSVRFVGDEYDIDLDNRQVLSLSCNVAAKDFPTILILHYLAQRLKGLPPLTGEWLNFRELSGIEGYSTAFRKRSIEPIIRKYGNNPEGILSCLERLPAKKINQADVGIILEVFEQVPARILLWRSDEEFGPDANMFFDRSITHIFCTEDIVVLAGIIASRI
jgi:hypothetical protein